MRHRGTACSSTQIAGEVDCVVYTERRMPMIEIVRVRSLVAVAAISIFSMGLSGCDYWPPALQTQVEQLRSELQSEKMERQELQNQLSSLAKVKDDLQAQVDDLTRASRDKTSMMNSLQNSLAAAQQRLAKSAKSASPKASAVKPSAKVTKKAPAKKNASTKKSAGVR
jgi:peptidoglycan hydrolase CwlO-like protein